MFRAVGRGGGEDGVWSPFGFNILCNLQADFSPQGERGSK
jgi:hypothetical protein